MEDVLRKASVGDIIIWAARSVCGGAASRKPEIKSNCATRGQRGGKLKAKDSKPTPEFSHIFPPAFSESAMVFLKATHGRVHLSDCLDRVRDDRLARQRGAQGAHWAGLCVCERRMAATFWGLLWMRMTQGSPGSHGFARRGISDTFQAEGYASEGDRTAGGL